MRLLYIDIDSLRPDHLGCYEYDRDTSPNIDAVARQGVRFDNCYITDGPCLPSRTAMWSGRSGFHTGVVGHGGRAAQPRIEGPSRGFRDAMAAGGVVVYETFMVGNEAFGRPTNPAFLLAPGELLQWAAASPPLSVVAFEQGRVALGARPAVVQRLVALDPAAGVPAALDPPAPPQPRGNAP